MKNTPSHYFVNQTKVVLYILVIKLVMIKHFFYIMKKQIYIYRIIFFNPLMGTFYKVLSLLNDFDTNLNQCNIKESCRIKRKYN